jgi:hypothetical protein
MYSVAAVTSNPCIAIDDARIQGLAKKHGAPPAHFKTHAPLHTLHFTLAANAHMPWT